MWYYLENGEQRGPVDDAALDNLTNTGAVSPQTLVWREGQAEWQPLQVSRSTALAAVPARATCSVCGKSFPSDEVIELLGRPVCANCKPALAQSLREGVMAPSSGGSVWVDRKNVVTLDQTTLPPRCFKCNQPAAGAPLKRTLQWHNPLFYLTILAGVLIYVIIAIIVRKRMTVDVHLCERHLRRRKNFIYVGWGGAALALALAIGGGVANIPALIGLSPFIFLIALIAGLRGASVTRATRMKDKTVWLTGAGPEFRASLPPWPG